MGRIAWATYLWPGLPQLWHAGWVAGLILAAGFALLLNVLLLASFVWVELLSPWHLRLGWSAIAALWVASAAVTARYGRGGLRGDGAAAGEDLFREALGEYLQRSWFEAERILDRLLRARPRDVEARLLLATLLRRTGRHVEAGEQLSRIELIQGAEKWCSEIAAERQLLAEIPSTGATPLTQDDRPGQPLSPQAA
jgi:hypothetical protein